MTSAEPDPVATLTPAPGPDFARDIHLSRALRPRGIRARGDARRQNFKSLVPVLRMPTFFTVGVVVTCASVAAASLARFTGMDFWLAMAVTVTAAVVGWLWFFSTRLLPAVPAGVRYTLADAPDEAYRLRLSGSPRQVHAIMGRPISCELFEPRVFPVPLAMPTPAWPAWTCYLVLTLGASVAWMFFRTRFTGAFGRAFVGPWDFWAIMCVAMVPFAWTWPTYLRITPGRLEVMRYRFLGIGAPALTVIDLRGARVHVDLGAGAVQIDDAAPGPPGMQAGTTTAHAVTTRTIILSNWGPPWTEIGRAIMEAARHEGDPVEGLPRDALVG